MPRNNKPAAPHAPRRVGAKVKSSVAAEAIAAARDLAFAGQHAQAIERATSALARRCDDAARLALLELRVESLIAQGEVERARADVDAMLGIADQAGLAAFAAQALNCQSLLHLRSAAWQPAVDCAARALAAAKRSRRTTLVGASLLRVAEAQMRARASEPALRNAKAAGELFESQGDAVRRGRAMWVAAAALGNLGHTVRSERAADEALALSRQSGDRYGEGNALNIRYREQPDLAVRLRGLHQALAAFRAAGNVSGQATIFNNLTLAYHDIGLYRQSNRMILQAMAIGRRVHNVDQVFNGFTFLAANASLMGKVDDARDHCAELMAMLPGVADPTLRFQASMMWGWTETLAGNPRAALPYLEETLHLIERTEDTSYPIIVLTYLCENHLALGDAAAALAASRRASELQLARERGFVGNGGSAADVWWWHHRALLASGERVAAGRALERAYGFLLDGIASLSDEGLRRSYLNKRGSYRALVKAWIEHARKRRLPAKRRAAHLAGVAELSAPFERLVDTGVRLNELRSAEELHEFLVDEVTELSGAERVLLVLESAGSLRVAGSLVPVGEDASVLLHSVTPWIEDARRARVATLRHLPEGADPLDQRSSLVVPLVAQQRLLGYVYADIDGAYGRFRDTDRDLMTMLAAQAAVALDNAQWAQGLERKVDERTAELTQALEQQTATADVLKVISKSPTDVQPVFDAIAERAMILCGALTGTVTHFDGELVHLRAFHGATHEATEAMKAAYPIKLGRGAVSARAIREHAPVQIPDVFEDPDYELKDASRAAGYKSGLAVPMFREGQVIGTIGVTRAETGVFPERLVALLQTFAEQAAIAIQNAKLFNETQEALGRQTATADILRVISSSPTNVQPVFDAIVRTALRLLSCDSVVVMRCDGNTFSPVAGVRQDGARNCDDGIRS